MSGRWLPIESVEHRVPLLVVRAWVKPLTSWPPVFLLMDGEKIFGMKRALLASSEGVELAEFEIWTHRGIEHMFEIFASVQAVDDRVQVAIASPRPEILDEAREFFTYIGRPAFQFHERLSWQ
jgi:hypothetical protein